MDDLDRMAERQLRLADNPHVDWHRARIARYRRFRLAIGAMAVLSYPWLLLVTWMTANQTHAMDLGMSLMWTLLFFGAMVGNWLGWQPAIDDETAAIGRLADGGRCVSRYRSCSGTVDD